MDRGPIESSVKRYFAERDDVAVAYLFGSVARDAARPDSDVDVGVLFFTLPDDPYERVGTHIIADLTSRLGVDVDVVVLNRAPSTSSIACPERGASWPNAIARGASPSRSTRETATSTSSPSFNATDGRATASCAGEGRWRRERGCQRPPAERRGAGFTDSEAALQPMSHGNGSAREVVS